MTAMSLALFWFIHNRYRRPFTSASCKLKHGILGTPEQRMRGGKLRMGDWKLERYGLLAMRQLQGGTQTDDQRKALDVLRGFLSPIPNHAGKEGFKQ